METFQKDILFTLQTHFKNISYNIFALKLSPRIHQRFTIIIRDYSKKKIHPVLYSPPDNNTCGVKDTREAENFIFAFRKKKKKKRNPGRILTIEVLAGRRALGRVIFRSC